MARALALFALLTTVTVADEPDAPVSGQSLPSPYYQTDDVQYFPAGPEFQLRKEVQAVREYRAAQPSAAAATPTIPSYQSTPPRAHVPAAYATTSPVVENESTRMLKENPTLVRQLLRLAEDEDEEVLATIYCLGPAVAKPLLAEIDGDDPAVRDAALSALTCVCAHEDAPRTEIVKVILAKIEKADEERAATLREVLQFVVRSMRPEFRATLRTALDQGLSDDF